LRERLRRQHPNWLTEAHERAARWFAGQDETRDAIEHALAAPVYPLALTFIETQIEKSLLRGEIVTVLAWLQRLPMQALEISTDVSLLAVLVWLMNGETAKATEILQFLEGIRPTVKKDRVFAGKWAVVLGFRELLI